MKELSIEEKAERFDEVVEKFDVILNLNTVKESGTIFADDVRKILPELKESEDERISNEIISLVHLPFSHQDEWELVEQNPEEDEGMLNSFLHKLEVCDLLTNKEIIWIKNKFKSIKDRVQPQPKQEWSEEDEKNYNRIYDIIHAAAFANYDVDEDGKECGEYAKITEWFKSLKERYTWKPSELPHWKKSNLQNDNTTGFNSDYFCHNGYCINYKELFEKLPKDD